MSATLTAIDLRTGTAADLPTIDTLMQEAFEPRFGEAWTYSQCAGVMAMPGVSLLIASVDGAAAGFAMTRTIMDEAELLLLATRPAERRRGIARALLNAVVAGLRDHGVAKLHLEVRAGNDAVALYRAAGFQKIGERRDYYRGKNGKIFDAHTFTRAIG